MDTVYSIAQNFSSHRIASQILPNGTLPYELARTKALWFKLFILILILIYFYLLIVDLLFVFIFLFVLFYRYTYFALAAFWDIAGNFIFLFLFSIF